MIDFHCHLLPGIDDGPIDVSESIIMATRLAQFGYGTVCCTPHCIKGCYDIVPDQVREATLMLQADLDAADVQLDLWPGIEYCLDEYFEEYADNLLPIGKTCLVLCEAPQQANPAVVAEGLQIIIDKGYVPLVAHPERSAHFYEMLSRRVASGASRDQPEDSESQYNEFEDLPSPRATRYSPRGFLKKMLSPRATRHAPPGIQNGVSLPEGCLFQANLGSFSGFYGVDIQKKSYNLLRAGVYDCIASDLHESRACSQVLRETRDKLESNPLLQRIMNWTPEGVDCRAMSANGEQATLF